MQTDPRRSSLLVVDDEEEILQIFKEFLEGSEFDLELAATGPAALEKLRRQRFDVVVTDLNLPGADGLAVLREAKAHDPQVEVLMLTGNASTLTAIEALRQGAYDYVLKPFDLFEMDQSIRRALERRRLLEERSRFVEELRRRVEEATLRIRTLYEVGQEITSSLHLGRTLSLILERSAQLTGAKECALFLLDDDGAGLECRGSRGFGEGEDAWRRIAPGLTALNHEVLAGRKPVREEMAGPDGEARSALIVPLLQGDEVAGSVAVLAGAAKSFTEEDGDLLVSLAAQASIAIHNARVYEKIRDLERLKSEFVAVVSHEVRTPLTSIKGSLELLADDKYFQMDQPQKELLGICQANAERLEALINDILDFSKLESSRLSSHFAETSIESLVEGVVVGIANLAERKRIRIVKDIAPALPPVMADELRITQVLNNLLSNAIKFSPAGSEMGIRVRTAEGGIQVEIQDQGPGIAPEDLPKLFARFRQLDSSSTRKVGGTGLGLVISKGIVEEHAGRIWAESTPGQGSRFSFWLPVGAPLPSRQPTFEPAHPSS